MEERFKLPAEIALDAQMRGNEYGWSVEQFPLALQNAKRLGYSCIGGQFQFRLPDGTYEMYWLDADAEQTESTALSCEEVLQKFNRRVAETDFVTEGGQYTQERIDQGDDPMKYLVFVGYFRKSPE